MKIEYRILSVRLGILSEMPYMSPVGIIFSIDGKMPLENVFLKSSRYTKPILPIILMWPDMALTDNFGADAATLEDIGINPLYKHDFALSDISLTKIKCEPKSVGEKLFRSLIVTHPTHRQRKPMFFVALEIVSSA